jgi:flagellar motor switch protein FliM
MSDGKLSNDEIDALLGGALNNSNASKPKISVLSQDEINQLLKAINSVKAEPEEAVSDSRIIKIYDFKRPIKFFKEHIITISSIFETFCRLTTDSLSAQIRNICHLHISSVDELTYEEFIRSIPTPTTLAIVNMNPLNGNALLEIDPAITFSIIDRICGGSGNEIEYQHELTDIEHFIMEKIIVRMLDNLRASWTTVLDLHPQLGIIDSNPKSVQIVPLSESVIMVTIETKIGDIEGMINFCIPYLTVEPIMERLSSRFWYGNYQNITPPGLSNLKLREDIPVRLTAEVLSRDYPVNEIFNWKTDTLILSLCKLSPDNCYLRLGDRRVWQCQTLPDCKGLIKRIKIINYAEKPFGTEGMDMKTEEVNSLTVDAMSSAKIRISVELGTTLKTVKEVFAMGEGTILELDKLAGEPVDVKANGVLFAHGEVVVIDENFGVKITEISAPPDSPNQKESA